MLRHANRWSPYRESRPMLTSPPTDPVARAAQGRAARKHVPRDLHADWGTSSARTAPARILEAQEETRVPELIPLRHQRMTESPFAFYRGAAAIMAADLARTPSSGLTVQ